MDSVDHDQLVSSDANIADLDLYYSNREVYNFEKAPDMSV